MLARAIPKHFDKIRFVEAKNPGNWQGLRSDLAINIDSIQEMPPATIDSYMEHLISNATYF